MGGYLPGSDLELQVWMNKFMAYLGANLAHFGLLPADVVDLADSEPEFSLARVTAEGTWTTYRGQVQDKNTKRETMESLIRPMVARIQAYPETTNQDREELGIPTRGNAPSVPTEIETSLDRPTAGINIGAPLRHTLRIQNDNEGTVSPGKPQGVKAVEVWVKIGEVPASPPTDMRYVNMSSRNTVVVPFAPEDGNKQAHYKMRWVYTNGVKGAWSDLESATIAA